MHAKHLMILFALIAGFACNRPAADANENEQEIARMDTSTKTHINKTADISRKKHKTSILLIQCSNGYAYASYGYDFNPILHTVLEKDSTLDIIPFPYKKLMGIAYQGVYDKKYTQPIFQIVPADIFIMTRFTGNVFSESPDTTKKAFWGYETKILNTKSMVQMVSIRGNHLHSYQDIEKHIISNMGKLINDIHSLQ